MKYLFFLVLLGFGGMDCCAQAPDSTRRRQPPRGPVLPGFLERRDRSLAEQMQRRQEEAAVRAEAWRRQPLFHVDSVGWSLSMNPLGILEPQAAFGLGIGYQFDPNWQLWLESSVLFQLYNVSPPSCVNGFREILALKYYFGARQSLFVAGEVRWKQVNYDDVANFYNRSDTVRVNNYAYRLVNIVSGAAVWFGGRVRLSDDHRWRIEPSVGLGFKGRTIRWHGVPEGYQYQTQLDKLNPFTTSPRENSGLTVYFPATLRFVYVL